MSNLFFFFKGKGTRGTKGEKRGRIEKPLTQNPKGVHLPAAFTLYLQFPPPCFSWLSRPLQPFFYCQLLLKRCCLISSNFFPFSPFENPHLPGTLPFPAPRIPPLYSPRAPPPPRPPLHQCGTENWKKGNDMGKHLHRTTDFSSCRCCYPFSILMPFGLLEWVLLIAWWQQALFSCVDDTNSCPLNSTGSLRMWVRTPRLWFS